MKIIGIDPGLSGAIAILENNKVLNIFEMPVMSEGKKNKRQAASQSVLHIMLFVSSTFLDMRQAPVGIHTDDFDC